MMKKLFSLTIALSIVGMAFFEGTVFQADTVIAANVQNMTVSIPERYRYKLTEEESNIVKQAAEADGAGAAVLVNSLENENAFIKAVESLLDIYYADDANVSGKLDDFSKNVNADAGNILKDYEDAYNERYSSENLEYSTSNIIVSFDKSVSEEEALDVITNVSAGGEIITKVYDNPNLSDEKKAKLEETSKELNVSVLVYLTKGQSTSKAIEIYSSMDFVESAELNAYAGAEEETFLLSEAGKTIYKGQSFSLKALKDDKITNQVIWSSSDGTVAKVSKYGKVTGISKGTAIITATSKTDENIKAICIINVKTYSAKMGYKVRKVRTRDAFIFNDEFITSYSQMKELIKKYSGVKNYDKNIMKKLKKYDKKYFKTKALCITTIQQKMMEKLSVDSVRKVMKSNGKFTINISIGRKYLDEAATEDVIGYQMFIEISQAVAKVSDKAVTTIKQ